MKVKRDLES